MPAPIGLPQPCLCFPPWSPWLHRQPTGNCCFVGAAKLATAARPAILQVGPNLAGVVGRKAASTQFNHSAALKGSGLTWTGQNLDRFLTAPSKTTRHAHGHRRTWSIVSTEKAGASNARTLRQFDAVIWNNISGDVLTLTQRGALQGFLKRGGGFVAVHGSAGDPVYFCDWHADSLIGARFKGHLSMGDHPIAWTNCQGKGRVFYPAIGHMPETYGEPRYVTLLRTPFAGPRTRRPASRDVTRRSGRRGSMRSNPGLYLPEIVRRAAINNGTLYDGSSLLSEETPFTAMSGTSAKGIGMGGGRRPHSITLVLRAMRHVPSRLSSRSTYRPAASVP